MTSQAGERPAFFMELNPLSFDSRDNKLMNMNAYKSDDELLKEVRSLIEAYKKSFGKFGLLIPDGSPAQQIVSVTEFLADRMAEQAANFLKSKGIVPEQQQVIFNLAHMIVELGHCPSCLKSKKTCACPVKFSDSKTSINDFFSDNGKNGLN